jgi:hypothetical protein
MIRHESSDYQESFISIRGISAIISRHSISALQVRRWPDYRCIFRRYRIFTRTLYRSIAFRNKNEHHLSSHHFRLTFILLITSKRRFDRQTSHTQRPGPFRRRKILVMISLFDDGPLILLTLLTQYLA